MGPKANPANVRSYNAEGAVYPYTRLSVQYGSAVPTHALPAYRWHCGPSIDRPPQGAEIDRSADWRHTDATPHRLSRAALCVRCAPSDLPFHSSSRLIDACMRSVDAPTHPRARAHKRASTHSRTTLRVVGQRQAAALHGPPGRGVLVHTVRCAGRMQVQARVRAWCAQALRRHCQPG